MLVSSPWMSCPVHRVHSGAGEGTAGWVTHLHVEGKGHKGILQDQWILVPGDPVGGTTQLQSPAVAPLDALNCSTSCSVSLNSHWLWEGGHAPSTSKPELGLALFATPEGMRQKNAISTSSKHKCYLQRSLIQLLASTQAAAVTYLSLQWVRRGLYKESRVVIFLNRKALENKALCIG